MSPGLAPGLVAIGAAFVLAGYGRLWMLYASEGRPPWWRDTRRLLIAAVMLSELSVLALGLLRLFQLTLDPGPRIAPWFVQGALMPLIAGQLILSWIGSHSRLRWRFWLHVALSLLWAAVSAI